MSSSETLFALLAIPTSLFALAACKGDKDTDTAPDKTPQSVERTPAPKDGPLGAPVNACVATDAKKVEGSRVCTDAEVAEHKGKFDGFSCFYETCVLPENRACPPDYEPRALSVPPVNVLCTFSNPMDL